MVIDGDLMLFNEDLIMIDPLVMTVTVCELENDPVEMTWILTHDDSRQLYEITRG